MKKWRSVIIAWLITIIAITVITMAMCIDPLLLPVSFDTQPVAHRSEKLVLRITKDSIYTTATYSSHITITVTGTGKMHPESYIDAFYQYKESNNRIERVSDPPYGGMRINGEPIFFIPQNPLPPALSNLHSYTFQYYAGAEADYLVFSVPDEDRSDNIGELYIEVSTQPLYGGR